MIVVYLGIASLLLYPSLVGAWLLSGAASARTKQVLGITAIVAAAPFFTLLGLLVSMFGNNMCYSNVVSTLVELPSVYAKSREQGAVARFTQDAKGLPLEGYETSCHTLRSAVEALATKASGNAR